MLSQSARASCSLLRTAQRHAFRRNFVSPTAIRQADLVQDLYLRELKNYKTPTPSPTDHEGHVQKFSSPKTPKSPEEGNIASELKSYEEQRVEVEGQASAGESGTGEEDWLEEEEENAAPAH